MIKSCALEAFNQVPHSENEIHGDKVAKDYGFKGGLVPGVTVSAYLCHPGVLAWGKEFLDSGAAHVSVLSPLYDGEKFEVQVIDQSEHAYAAQLVRPDGTVSARAEVSIAIAAAPAPVYRGDPVMNAETKAPRATPENMARLQAEGCLAARFRWDQAHDMHTYLTDQSKMPELLQMSGGGWANTSFVLGCSNWILARNARMNPWVHMETRHQHYEAIPLGAELVAEMTVADLFAKKGHEFVDANVALFDRQDKRCYATIELRAIYKLRGL